jgi:hypothetical protein
VIKLSPQSVEFNGEELFILEGSVTDLIFSESTENLLEQIQGNSRSKATAVGSTAALTGMANIVASSAALVFYDGEDTYNFAALVNKKDVVCGTFNGAATFENGEAVRFVVAKRGDAHFAHAAYRLKPKVLMIPSMTYNGDNAHLGDCMRTGRNIFIGWFIICHLLCFYIYFTGSSEKGFPFFISAAGTLLGIAAGFGMEYWTYKSTRDWGLHGSAIFKALGVPRPDDFSLYGHLELGRTSVPFGYLFEEALEAHLKRYPELVSQKT